MCPLNDVLTDWCVIWPMCPRTDVFSDRWAHRLMCPLTNVPTDWCAHVPVSPKSNYDVRVSLGLGLQLGLVRGNTSPWAYCCIVTLVHGHIGTYPSASMLGDIEIGFLRTHSILASLAQTVPHKLVPFNHQPYQSAYQTCLPLNKWTSQSETVQTYQAINTVPPLFFQSLDFRLCLESQSCALFLLPAWYKINWINCLFFMFGCCT